MKLQLLPSLTSLPCIDLTSSILVNPAHTWEKLCGLRDPKKLTTIVVHHDAIKKATHPNKTALEYASIIANGHIGITTDHAEGEPGNPYHLMIRGGRAHQNNDLLVFTYGVSNHNPDTIHLCIAGEYRYTDTITSEDYNMLVTAIVSLLKCKELPNLRIIKGHREMPAETECPGIDMNQLRDDVGKIMLQMNGATDPGVMKRNIYTATHQHKYLYDQYAADPVGQKWLEPHLVALYDAMKERGLFFGSE